MPPKGCRGLWTGAVPGTQGNTLRTVARKCAESCRDRATKNTPGHDRCHDPVFILSGGAAAGLKGPQGAGAGRMRKEFFMDVLNTAWSLFPALVAIVLALIT